ncbi:MULTISPECIES: RodZ domain-containing protein [Gemmobacter]|jgi:cytoskeletal protein RodZ|uniref:4-hydroxy-3-methylbut-2-en-1-yl diphosphate synthase n=1 Tax=Gemmobacter nanjingensis TaxID=488454 RepID=A0ABQ3FAF9_9RHOB|nr:MULTISPECIES: RodZ domain-containing protein [Gemmobacter]OJY27303.1 MAG: helix-turn-helix domain-containing protein [Rhodobacterales bacterium 65-51]GHC15800.1 4-hydroxy-3-methylbut-2-en-1-yl diphosphate synthase [Gemmobacter nanjingensis]
MIWRRNQPSTAEADKPKGFDDFELRLGDVMRGERATLGKSLLDVQRELKIKATYIAAIENCDVSAFETQGFVAGYVRSYARYLGMDPDWAFKRFCAEANFEVAHGMSAAAAPATITAARSRVATQSETRDPLGNPNALFVPRSESWIHRVEPGAIGSVLVLAALIGALGYGGWSVLQEVQRVQLAPVDQAPVVVADIDPLEQLDGVSAGRATVQAQTGVTEDPAAQQVAGASPDLMNRLYRPQALDVPVLVSRDGPIASIDPRQTGTLAAASLPQAGGVAAVATPADPAQDQVQVVAQAEPGVEILAVRPSWVRVSSADGSTLFEKILNAGERYKVPQLDTAPVLRSGNSGSVYFVMGGKAFGPAAPGPQVVKNIALSEEALTQKYAEADLSDDADLARIVNVAQATQIDAPQE